MYLHEPYGIAATSSYITHSRKQHLLISDSLYDFSTFKRKRLVILEPKTASHYHDQSLPVIDQSLPGPKFHDQSFANHGPVAPDRTTQPVSPLSGRHNRCRPHPDDTTEVAPVRTIQPMSPPSGRHNRCRPRPDDTTGVAPVQMTQLVLTPSGRHNRCPTRLSTLRNKESNFLFYREQTLRSGARARGSQLKTNIWQGQFPTSNVHNFVKKKSLILDFNDRL
jgi:hypothetical protein